MDAKFDPVLFLVVKEWACKFLRMQIFFLSLWSTVFFKVTIFIALAHSELRRRFQRSLRQPTLQTVYL